MVACCPATRGQRRALLGLLEACREVYNAGLQERREAYRHPSQTRVALFDQFGQVTGLRGVRDDVLGWGIQPLRWALRRVDQAFAGFFARVNADQTPGYPRFKKRRPVGQASATTSRPAGSCTWTARSPTA